MYQLGDRVVYGIHGVCTVAAQEVRIVDKKQVTYLVLEPIGQGGSRYLVPTHNTAAMSKLQMMITKEALGELLVSDEIRVNNWIKDENQRKQTYRDLISSGNRAKLMCMVRSLYLHKEAQTAAGKKCHLCDENFLRDAEKLLTSEISVVMDMDTNQARSYLKQNLLK